MPFFTHKAPTLRLRRPSQEVLRAALRGLTDAEAAEELNLSKAAVKRRWAVIFEEISRTRPDVIPPSEGDKRGPEKRTKLLHFVREHPEEIRPFRYSKI